MPEPKVVIYTDGGADPNPGPGGWGAVLLHAGSGKTSELSGGEPHTTNNRMELTAAIRALEALTEPCEVELFTDSQYLKNGITKWLPGWITRGWQRKDGELKNEDLWRLLAELVRSHRIRWGWVKGHAGNRHNERADQLATAAIRALRSQRSAGGVAATAAGRPPAPPAQFRVFLRVAKPGRQGGWAALVREGETETVLSGASVEPSANRLDLIAAGAALARLPRGATVEVFTGSDYLRKGASQWLEGWRQRGWKTKEGGAVVNRDLWERLAAELAARRVAWPDVKGEEVRELIQLAGVAREAALGAG